MAAVRIPSVRGGRPRCRPRRLAADKGYSCARIRLWLRCHGIRAVIPQRRDQVGRRGRPPGFDAGAYRRRNAIERCVGWLKEWRGVATRSEKMAENYLGVVHLAMIHRYLRLLDSSHRP
jgi:transposase